MAAFTRTAEVGFSDNPVGSSVVFPAFASVAGRTIVGYVSHEDATSTSLSISDTAGNTYIVGTPTKHSAADNWITYFYCLSSLGNASNVITITLGASKPYRNAHAAEYSVIGSAAFVGTNYTEGNATTLTSASLTLTSTDGLLYAGTKSYNSTAITAGGAGALIATQGTFGAASEQFLSTTGSYTVSFDYSPAYNANIQAVLLAAGVNETSFQSDGFQHDAFQIYGGVLAGGGPTNYADNLSVGTYAYSGKTVSDSVVKSDALSVGAYVYSGKAATDVLAKNDSLTKGTYTVSGQSITDIKVVADSLSVGAYAISGKDVTDVVTTGGGSVAYADNLSAGAYAYAGQSVTDSKAIADSLTKGTYALAGQAIADAVGRQDALAKGSYVYTGLDLTDVKTGATAYIDSLLPGAYLITGQSITDVAPSTGSSYSAEVELRPRKFYIKRKKQILIFDSAEQADAFLDAERLAEEAVQQAQKTSRLARKRLRTKIFKAIPLPEAVAIDFPEFRSIELPDFASQQDLAEFVRIALIAQDIQDEDDLECLLMCL